MFSIHITSTHLNNNMKLTFPERTSLLEVIPAKNKSDSPQTKTHVVPAGTYESEIIENPVGAELPWIRVHIPGTNSIIGCTEELFGDMFKNGSAKEAA